MAAFRKHRFLSVIWLVKLISCLNHGLAYMYIVFSYLILRVMILHQHNWLINWVHPSKSIFQNSRWHPSFPSEPDSAKMDLIYDLCDQFRWLLCDCCEFVCYLAHITLFGGFQRWRSRSFSKVDMFFKIHDGEQGQQKMTPIWCKIMIMLSIDICFGVKALDKLYNYVFWVGRIK